MSRLGSALLGSNEYARPLICPPMEKTSGKPTRLERVCNNQRCGRSGTELAILCTHTHWLAPHCSGQSCWLAIEDLRSREWRAGWVSCEHSRCLVLGASALLHGAALQKWLLYDCACVASLESSISAKISCRIAVLLGARSTLVAAPVSGCLNGSACHVHSTHC